MGNLNVGLGQTTLQYFPEREKMNTEPWESQCSGVVIVDRSLLAS
jgi:hypothetical protein